MTSYQQILNYRRGERGEKLVKRKLCPLIFGRVYHKLINNYIILDKYKKSHQIDHIEIRKNGIFCIETKNIKGILHADENAENRTTHLYNGEAHTFRNPIKQNQSHVYHVQEILGNKYKVYSIIVMVRDNVSTTHFPNVIGLRGLKKYLKKFDNGDNYTKDEINEIYTKLERARSTLTTAQHIRNIKQTNEELKKFICPRCGNFIALRHGKYNDYYGCINYPKCTFTIDKDKFDNL